MWNHRFGSNDDDEVSKSSDKGQKQGEKTERQLLDKKVDRSLEKKMPSNIKPKSSKITGTGLGSSDMSRGQFMKLTSIGTELLAAVLVGTFLGWAVNRMLGNRYPWIIAIGVIVGAMAGMLNIYRLIVEEEEKDRQQRERQREEQDKGASSR
jgi:F0F1-type ATP synthase assembly protein I